MAVLDASGDGSVERRIPLEHLQVGDRFVVRPGEKVPVTLRFERAGELKVELPVSRQAPAAGHKH